MVWNLFPFKSNFSFGKRQKLQGCRGTESPGWFDVWRRDAWSGTLLWWSCQSPDPIAAAFWVIWIVSVEECSSLTQKFDAETLLYSLSHFEWDSHTVHMLTQWHLLPPLTNTVKSSLFTHANSSPLSLAASLHRCRANHSFYINNGWTFSDRPHICQHWTSWVKWINS